jgi:hypothetical protein
LLAWYLWPPLWINPSPILPVLARIRHSICDRFSVQNQRKLTIFFTTTFKLGDTTFAFLGNGVAS